MMNKKGFTLIELLTVIVIIGIISLIAVPNMIGISDDLKKEQMLDDAKKLISLAKMKINIDYDARNSSTPTKYYFSVLNSDGSITTDPDGGLYDPDGAVSYVKYTKDGDSHYCIYLQGSKRHIGTALECVNEENLHSKANVRENDV